MEKKKTKNNSYIQKSWTRKFVFVATEMGIEPNLREKRVQKRRKQFNKCGEKYVTLSAEQSFKVNYFICLLDHVDVSLQFRFE